MKKRNKKYNPMKVAQLVTGYAAIIHPGVGRSMVLMDMRSMTAFNPTQKMSDVLLKRVHKWTVVTSVVMDVNGQTVIKSDEHAFSQPYRHKDLVQHLTDSHAEQMRNERSDCVTSFGWIAIPRQVSLSPTQIDQLYQAAERFSPKTENMDNCEHCGDALLFDFVHDRYMECHCRSDYDQPN